MAGPRVAFETLGCKLNQYETEAIAAGFLGLGWCVVDSREAAEAYVINTCTVTNKADRKSRNVFHRFLGLPFHPIVVVTGCFAESAKDRLEATPGITFVVPNRAKNQIGALVDAYHRGAVSSPRLPLPNPFGFPVPRRVFHTRATLKIQDGCDNFCSFCIIPSVRGRAISRPWIEVLEEARSLISQGRKELVLSGVNMGRWTDGERNFAFLVRSLLNLEGDFRVRITSLEPDALGDDFLELFDHPKMCPHLHLCLQSGSTRILFAMGRQYTLDDYTALVHRLRSRRPSVNLTTDLIAGFPGETPEDFEKTLEALRFLRWGDVHAFPFSPRKETRAQRMPGQIPDTTKAVRTERLRQEAQTMRLEVMNGLIGESRRVLVETPGIRTKATTLRGVTEDYFPVRFPGVAAWNEFVDVRLVRVESEGGQLFFQASVVPV